MEQINHVVAHFMDGSVVKGTTEDFSANRPTFHLHEFERSNSYEIPLKKLKAVFFVKDLRGNPERRDILGFIEGPGETNQGKKVGIRFKDGEVLFGYTLSWTKERTGFFLTPADPGSNNLRVYVMSAATREVKVGSQADEMARQAQERKAA